jgi:hypothetical protein
MKKLVFLIFISQIAFGAAGQVFDQQSFLDLSRLANNVQEKLSECARIQNLNLNQLYPRKLSSCDIETRSSLRNLKDSFKLFTLSSLVENFGQVKNTEKISPLLIQIISENISQFKLDETKQGGGPRGLGLCFGFISIEICSDSTVHEIPPEINEEHMAYLKLFDLIPDTQCDLGIFPTATVTLINEIADAQGLVGARASNNVMVKDGVMIIGPIVQEMRGKKPSSELIRRLDGKFFMTCALMPSRESATSFFRSQIGTF